MSTIVLLSQPYQGGGRPYRGRDFYTTFTGFGRMEVIYQPIPSMLDYEEGLGKMAINFHDSSVLSTALLDCDRRPNEILDDDSFVKILIIQTIKQGLRN